MPVAALGMETETTGAAIETDGAGIEIDGRTTGAPAAGPDRAFCAAAAYGAAPGEVRTIAAERTAAHALSAGRVTKPFYARDAIAS